MWKAFAKHYKRKPFSFLEILIAMAILGISLTVALSIVSGARSRVLRAEQRWARQHNLDQATEFFLSAGPDATVPGWLLPKGFRAECELIRVENLPEYAQGKKDKFTLARYEIRVIGLRNEVVAENTVEKIVPEKILQ